MPPTLPSQLPVTHDDHMDNAKDDRIMLRAMRIMAGWRCGLTRDGLLAPCHCQSVRKRQGRESHIGIDTHTETPTDRQTDTHVYTAERERERYFFQSISVLLVKICLKVAQFFLILP